MQQTSAKELKQIRMEVGLSIQLFADIWEIKKPTLQGYESGRRPVPTEVMQKARAQLQRTRQYWRDMDIRIAANLINGRCPNEASGGFL